MEASSGKRNNGLQIWTQLLHPKEQPRRPLVSHPPGFFRTDDEYAAHRKIRCQETQSMALKDEAVDQTMNKMEEDTSFFISDGVYEQNKDEIACPLAKDPQEIKTAKTGRGRKYTIDEDIAICKAVAATSKHGDTCKYWERIFTIFEGLHANPDGRNQHGICNRFFVINKEVMKYINILAHVRTNKANSLTEVDVVRTARAEYYSQEGKPFAFEECYKILQAIPNYSNKAIRVNNTQSTPDEGASTTTTPTVPDEDLEADGRTKRCYSFSSSEGFSPAQTHQAKKVRTICSSPVNSAGEADAFSVEGEFKEAKDKSSFHGCRIEKVFEGEHGAGGNEELIADAVGYEGSLVNSVDKECVVGAGNERVSEQVVLMNVKDVVQSRIEKVDEERDDQVKRVNDYEVCQDEHNLGDKEAKFAESAHQGNMGVNSEQVEMRYGLDGQVVKDVGEVVDKNNSMAVVSGISSGAAPTRDIGPPIAFGWFNDIYDSVEGFKVLKEFGSLYRKIWQRYGHIPPPSTLKQESLGIVGICTDILVVITEMKACTISDVSEDHLASWEGRIALGQSLKFNLDWLVNHLSKIRASLKPWSEMAVGLKSTRKALGAAEKRLTRAFGQHDERAARVAALQKEMDQLNAQLKEDNETISICKKEIQIHQMVLDSIWSPALQKSLVDDLF